LLGFVSPSFPGFYSEFTNEALASAINIAVDDFEEQGGLTNHEIG